MNVSSLYFLTPCIFLILDRNTWFRSGLFEGKGTCGGHYEPSGKFTKFGIRPQNIFILG